MTAAGALLGAQLAGIARQALQHETVIRDARTRHEEEILRRVASRSVSGRAHDPVTAVQQVLDEAAVAPDVRRDLDAVLDELRKFAAAYRSDPEGLAASIERSDGPLDRYGVPEKVDWAPDRLQRPLLFAGKVLDEIRILHNSDIEYAALVDTLSSRALIVGFAPWLSRYSSVSSPLARGRVAAGTWATMTAWSTSIALVAPQVAALVMDRDEPGARARRALLAVEVPLAVTGCVTAPGWPIVCFASGWTNYWQRPGPAFYPRRLVAFVAAVIGSQAFGLRAARTSAGRGAAEVLTALAVIAWTGGSYGAMVPLSASALVQTLVSETSRGERAAALGANVLRRTAEEMRTVAGRLEQAGNGPETRRAIDELNKQAAVLIGAAPEAELELQRLVDHAISSSTPSFTVGTPSFSSRDLRASTVREQADADVLAEAIRHCHQEARIHGQRQVLTDVKLHAGRLVVTVLNDIKPDPSPGAGVGKHLLLELVQRLPGGHVDQPGAELTEGVRAGMWRVQFSCDARILGNPGDEVA